MERHGSSYVQSEAGAGAGKGKAGSLGPPSPGEFVEELLVERLVLVLAPEAEEDVAADELVGHLKPNVRTLLPVVGKGSALPCSPRRCT